MMDQQYIACQHANGQFCKIHSPFQPLTNPPSCITALYGNNDQAIGKQCSLSISHVPHTFLPIAVTSNLSIIPSNPETLASTITIIFPDKAMSTVPLQQPFHILCRATSRYFHLPPHYEDHTMTMITSQNATNINAINISTQGVRIWKHFNSNWTTHHQQKLANVPEVPVTYHYISMVNTSETSSFIYNPG